jgi:hypothetical protein
MAILAVGGEGDNHGQIYWVFAVATVTWLVQALSLALAIIDLTDSVNVSRLFVRSSRISSRSLGVALCRTLELNYALFMYDS